MRVDENSWMMSRFVRLWGERPMVLTEPAPGGVDHDVAATGSKSFRFDHMQPKENDRWGSLSQRIVGLRPNTDYIVRFSFRSQAPADALFVTTDRKWHNRTYIPLGTGAWQPSKPHEFNMAR